MKTNFKRSGRLCLLSGLVVFLFLAGQTSCELGDSEDDDTITVIYEVRSSGCNNYTYGEWEQRCYTSDNYRSDLSLEDIEGFYTNDINCELNCCVSFQYRNVEAYYGTCGDRGLVETD